jgi:secretion/DNA translocation related TadE-like protein
VKPAVEQEHGSGSILAVALLAVVLAATSAALPLAAVVSTRRIVAGAADAAALAGASILLGLAPGSACESATAIALANGAKVTVCSIDDTTITVQAEREIAGMRVSARATAGEEQTR